MPQLCRFAPIGGRHRCTVCGNKLPASAVPPLYALCRGAPSVDCRHRGQLLRRQACPSCSGRVELKIFACAVHGECTLGARTLPGLAACALCPDFAPRSDTVAT